MEPRHQIYIDPVYVKGNILRVYLWWDYHTRMDIQVTFPEGKIIKGDKYRWIGFFTELMRRCELNFVMSKDEFVNLQFKQIKDLDIKIVNIEL